MNTQIKNKKTANILIVDDSNTNILLLKSILETDGFSEIKTAFNGKSAMELFDEEVFDLVLLDIRMPNKISGYDVLQYIKNDPLKKDTPVILVSANISMEDITKGLDLGALDYITKPVNINKLIEILNNLFE